MQDETVITFGHWLKRQRESRGLTQARVAARVGCATITLRKIEASQRHPSRQIAERLADALQVAPQDREAFIRFAREDAIPPFAHSSLEPMQTRFNSPHQLPQPTSPLFGRARQIGVVRDLLSKSRLVTLVGVGGIGKTRLALGTASELYGEFPDGVYFIDLSAIRDPALTFPTIARSMHIQVSDKRSPVESLIDSLHGKRTLLVLDNFEQLLPAAPSVLELLTACHGLKVLVTSREVLALPGEQEWRVPPLEGPDLEQMQSASPLDEYPAVALFVHHASLVRPEFHPEQKTLVTVAQICHHLEGIPLAIELAAARVKVLSPEEIAERLTDRYRLLTGGNHTALPRHQTLRGTIDWSYGLLSEPERILLRRLSVFAGGWTLEAAEAMCIDENIKSTEILDLLTHLVDKSLVEVDQAGGRTRYSMLETIREYAYEKLIETGEHVQAHQRHLEYFTGSTESPELDEPQQIARLDRLETELDNLRAALKWAEQTKDVLHSERLIRGLLFLWYERGYCVEGRKWIEAALPLELAGISSARVTACVASGVLAYRIGLLPCAYAALAEAVSVAHQLGDVQLIVETNANLASVTLDDNQAVQLLEEAVRLAHESGMEEVELTSRMSLASRAFNHGDTQQAAHLIIQALADARATGNASAIANALWWQGRIACEQGDYAEARQALEESVGLAREMKSSIRIADPLIDLAVACLYQGDTTRAMEAIRESITLFHAVGNLQRVGQCFSVAAGVMQTRGDPRHAAILLGATERVWRSLGEEMWHMVESRQIEIIVGTFHRYLPIVRSTLNPADFDKAWAEGQRMTTEQTKADVMAL